MNLSGTVKRGDLAEVQAALQDQIRTKISCESVRVLALACGMRTFSIAIVAKIAITSSATSLGD